MSKWQRIGTAGAFANSPKPDTSASGEIARGATGAALSFNKSQSFFDFNPDPKSKSISIFYPLTVDTIGNIWKSSEKIRKENKKFKRL